MAEVSGVDSVKKLERDWRSMISISHDFFHRWRMVVEDRYGKEEAADLAKRFWESVGEGTAASYLKRGKDTEDLEQIVNYFVKASLVMGEAARIVREGKDVLLVHDSCPWVDTYRDYGAPGQCQAGCDRWFQTALQQISEGFSVQTESSLAAGDINCSRRFSEKNNK